MSIPPQQHTTPPIYIQNNNTNIHSPHPTEPPKKEGGKVPIWVAIIGLIGVLSVPIIAHYLPEKEKKVPVQSTECRDLKKQLNEETTELQQIETLLKSQPKELKLQADKVTHINNIQSLTDKINKIKCD